MPNKLTAFVFDRIGVPKFTRYLDLSAFRHKLISGNVANVSTPGYRRRDIDFEMEFAKATNQSSHLPGATTHPDHLPLGSHPTEPPKIEKLRVPEGEMNSVDIDHEVADLARNELLFSVGARLLQKKLAGLRNAITSK